MRKGAVTAEKGFALFMWNEDKNDIIKIIKSLVNSGVLIDGVTDTEGGFIGALLAPLAAWLLHPEISSIVNSVSGRGLVRAGRAYIDKKFSYAPPFKYNQD